MSLEDELLKQRLERTREVEALGFRSYGRRFDVSHTVPEILADRARSKAEVEVAEADYRRVSDSQKMRLTWSCRKPWTTRRANMRSRRQVWNERKRCFSLRKSRRLSPAW